MKKPECPTCKNEISYRKLIPLVFFTIKCPNCKTRLDYEKFMSLERWGYIFLAISITIFHDRYIFFTLSIFIWYCVKAFVGIKKNGLYIYKKKE